MTLEMKYDELREEALAEGLAEGLKKGLEQGLSQGLKQGKKEKSYDTARKMKVDNISIDTIVKYTSLSKEEILAL